MNRSLRLVESGYVGLINLLAIVSLLLLMGFTAWISLEVFLRALGFGTMLGVVDFTEYSIYSIALLSAPWILHKNGHVRILIVTERLPQRWQAGLGILTDLLSAVVCVVLAYFAAINFLTSVERNEMIFGELIIPEWWLQWQAPVAFGLLAIGFLREIALVAKSGITAGPIVKE